MKLIKRMPRVCKAVIRAKGGYFEETRIGGGRDRGGGGRRRRGRRKEEREDKEEKTCFQLFHTFLLIPHVFILSFGAFSENKGNTLNEKVCPNF